jgi:hypothetical protein
MMSSAILPTATDNCARRTPAPHSEDPANVNSAEEPTFPPGRYGRRRTPGGPAKPLVALVVVVMLGVMAFIGLRLYRAYGDQDYSAEVTRFTTAEGAVDVEFIIRLPEGGRAECVVRARDAAGYEVGRSTVTVTAGTEPKRTRATYRLVTTGKPVTGELDGCTPASTR